MTVRPRPSICRKLRSASEGAPLRERSLARSSTCQPAPAPAVGVSAAFLIGFLAQHRPAAEAPEESQTTRAVAAALHRRRREAGETGAYADALAEERHFVTGGPLAGRAEVHVVHSWDSSFADLVGCLATDAGGDLDRAYSLDVFTADPRAPAEDPVAEVQRAVAAAREVLLVLDAGGRALSRLWVLFESMLALAAGKLRVRCSAPGGFGASEAALLAWEEGIDAADWVLSQATRKADERRLRAFAERAWEAGGGRGSEQRLAQLKRFLRREVYGQVLLGAVERGDLGAACAALERGASAEQRDALGNSAEELAAFHGHAELEELLFARRMQAQPHQRLSAFFRPAELLAASAGAHPEVLAPFLTEAAEEGEEGEAEEGEEGEEELEERRRGRGALLAQGCGSARRVGEALSWSQGALERFERVVPLGDVMSA